MIRSVPEVNDKFSPLNIYGAVQAAPPAQRQTIVQSYVGVRVKWNLAFQNIHVNRFEGKEIGSLMFVPAKSVFFPWISCEVDLKKYPELKTSNDGDRIEVEGTISSRSMEHEINLKGVSLKFIN